MRKGTHSTPGTVQLVEILPARSVNPEYQTKPLTFGRLLGTSTTTV